MAAKATDIAMTSQAGNVELQTGSRFSSVITDMDRGKAIRHARLHSLVVRVLRLTLPLAALAVAGLYILSLDLGISTGKITLHVQAIRTVGNDLEMIRPEMTGVTGQNGKFVITAEKSRQSPSKPDLIQLFGIDARLTQPANKEPSRMRADKGLYNVKRKLLDLEGRIRISMSNGLRARLSRARLFIDEQKIVSKGPVDVDMLNGRVQAQKMVLWSKERRARFVGAVRVRIRKRAGAPSGRGQPDTKAETLASVPVLRGRQ